MPPEFSRALPVERIPPAGAEEIVEAELDEREALARRFGLTAIHALRGRFTARPWRRGGVEVRGHVEAEVEQISVISLEPFIAHVSEAVTRYYQAETTAGHRPAAVSLEALEDDEPDVIAGGAIDLGELAAETLALALDPYPRRPGEVFSPDQGVAGGGKTESPFQVLERLKKP